VSVALEAFAKRTDLQKFAPNALAIFALQLRFGIDDPDELAESVTDGEGDKKVDVFYIDDEFGVAVIVQAYESENADKVNPPLNKVTDLNTAVSWLIKPSTIEGLRPEIESAAAQLEAALEDGLITSIEIWYSHNCPDNPDVDKELEQVAVTAKALLDQVHGEKSSLVDVRGLQVGRDQLDNLYAQRTQQILIEDSLNVPSGAWLEQQGEAWSAVYTSVPGSWLRELHARFGADRLFAGNVRDFLGMRRSRTNINHTIATTVRDRPHDFWAFNNGVTALVSEILADAEKNELSIRGITIVNGAQTTGALNAGEATEDVKVLMRFVKCTDRAVVQELIRANNTQNAIVSSDFRSTDRHQTRLREEFKAIPFAHYTGARRGEVAEAEAGDKDVHISADLAAQALAALHGEPQRAYHGKSRIWEDEPLYDRFFGPTSAPHIVYATSLVRAINNEKRRLREKPERSQVEQRIVDFLSQRGAPFLLASAIGRCQEMIVDVAVTDLFRLSFGNQVSPAVAEEYWTSIVRSLAGYHGKLAAAAESGKIRSTEVREGALEEFVAAVYSNLDALKQSVFAGFRPHVVVAQGPEEAQSA
jgi:hypothetical protein